MLRVIWLIRLLAFIPFFFALLFILAQSRSAYFAIKYRHEFKKSRYVIEDFESHETARGVKKTIMIGRIMGDTLYSRLNFRDYYNVFPGKKVIFNDTIDIWLYRGERTVFFPKFEQEKSFHVFNYIYTGQRIPIFVSILSFIIVSLIYKKINKKLKAI